MPLGVMLYVRYTLTHKLRLQRYEDGRNCAFKSVNTPVYHPRTFISVPVPSLDSGHGQQTRSSILRL